MSGETQKDESGWTVDTLRSAVWERFNAIEKLLDERHIAQGEAVKAALTSAKDAVTKAEAAADKRFEAMNEFRGQLADQAKTFMPRAEAEQLASRNAERITDLADRLSRIDVAMGADTGKGEGRAQFYGWIAGSIGLVIAIVTLANLFMSRGG